MTNKTPTEIDYFWSALMFYTRIRAPKSAIHSQQVLDKSRKYFPMIGVIVGGIAALSFTIASLIFSPALSIVISMIASIFATGAFHEDGFADSCDGFGGGWNHEQILTIMKDSRLGTYGAIGLVFLLALKFLTLLEIANKQNILTFALIIIAAHTLSRSISSVMIDLFDYVQDIDKSKIKPITRSELSFSDSFVSHITCVFTLLAIAYFAPINTLISTLVAVTAAFMFMAYSRKRIGGYTGDVLGAIQQLSEVSFYLCFAATI